MGTAAHSATGQGEETGNTATDTTPDQGDRGARGAH